MAKRPMGKHAKTKASLKKSKRDSSNGASYSSDIASGRSADGPQQAAFSQNIGGVQVTVASAPIAEAGQTQAMPAQPMSSQATQAIPAQAAQEIPAHGATSPNGNASAGSFASQDASFSQGKASAEAFMATAEKLNKRSAKRKKTAKILGITSLSLVGAIAAVYLVGVFVFSTHFMPNTHISDIDLTMKTAQDLHSDFEEKVGNYSMAIKGNGMDLDVPSKEADVKVDSYSVARDIFAGQNPWAWPIESFADHDGLEALSNHISADSLSSLIKKEVRSINKNGTNPKNAYCAYSNDQNQFVVMGEQLGTKLDYDSVMKQVLLGIMKLENVVVLDPSTLKQPKVKSTDERLVKAATKANKLASANLTIKMNDNKVGTVDSKDISKWIKIDSKYKVSFDEEAMNKWVTDLAESLNTVGSERTYTRPDGKKCTVSGGDYGWAINQDGLVSALTSKIKNGKSGDVDVPVLQSGKDFTGIGKKDWGKRYIDVDLSQQHAIFYGDDGKVIWESDIVSGRPTAGRATPQGVFDINLKGMNITLVGRENGKETYRTKVTYWMPFKDNAVGFHDATWQPYFGGSRYLSGGSHGCVNLPKSKAEELYGLLEVGDVVVVHT